MWKAWNQLTKHRHFPELLLPHFKKSKGFNYNKFMEKIVDPDWQHDWYKNNVVKAQLIKKLDKIDFTYIDNVIQMNHLAIETKNARAINQVYNTAVGDRITILEMTKLIRQGLSKFADPGLGSRRAAGVPRRPQLCWSWRRP